MEEVKFLEERQGVKSFTRLSIAWYFWCINVPGSLWILYVVGDAVIRGALTLSDGGMMLGIFVVLQLGWIAPKQLSKINEVKEFIAELKK